MLYTSYMSYYDKVYITIVDGNKSKLCIQNCVENYILNMLYVQIEEKDMFLKMTKGVLNSCGYKFQKIIILKKIRILRG